jgi:hypothetical protein
LPPPLGGTPEAPPGRDDSADCSASAFLRMPRPGAPGLEYHP